MITSRRNQVLYRLAAFIFHPYLLKWSKDITAITFQVKILAFISKNRKYALCADRKRYELCVL